MRYKLIVFDIDGTLTRHVSSWQYLHERMEIWDREAHVYQKRFRAGRISYAEFCRLDARHWKGLPIRKIRRLFREIPYARHARRSIHLLRRRGFKLAAVSTGLQFIADRIRKELGFHYDIANRLMLREGRLTGAVRIRVSHGGKGAVIRRIFRTFGVKPEETICVGDGDGDIPMARLSGYSIAFNSSSSKLSRAADYVCKTKDFREVYRVICDVTFGQGRA